MDMSSLHHLAVAKFMPHGYCYNWIVGLVSLHVISDSLIALSYYLIPFTLVYFVYKREDLPFNWIFICFGIFIISCGSTHLMEVWTLWHANYWLSGYLKLFTAVVSLITAVLLIKLLPAALRLPSPGMLATANQALEKEIQERRKNEIALESALTTIRNDKIHIEEQNKQVEKANRLKSEFLANMSHELRTPLNGIIGFTQTIHDGIAGPISSEQKEYLVDVLNSAQHLLTIINEILDLSVIEAGKMKFHPQSINLNQLITEVTDGLSIQLRNKNMQLNIHIDPKLSNIIIDPAKLKQIFYNYLSNAIKFTDQGGQVEIRVHPENENYFRLEVKDSGIGICEEDLASLFTVFHQLDASTAKKYPGTGLGLALVRSIVRALGGKEGVTSTLNEGSTFYAILPYRCGS